MANNIFAKEANAQLMERLQKLTPESRPVWGKMTVSQMLLHCQKPIDVAEGNLIIHRNILGFLFGKMVKRQFIRNMGFKKNSPTAPEFKITSDPDFEKEHEVLLSLVKKFGDVGPDVIANKEHPLFGKMTDEEWGILQYVHLDHHLKQFGV